MPFKLAFIGWLIGMSVCVPIGMLGLFMLNCTVRHGYKTGLAIACPSSLLDVAYCMLGLAGYAAMVPSHAAVVFQIVALGALLAVGFRSLKEGQAPLVKPQALTDLYDHMMTSDSRPDARVFLRMLMIVCLNPLPLVFWLNVGGILQSNHLMSGKFAEFWAVAVGVGIGAFCIQSIAMVLVRKLRRNHPSVTTHLSWIGVSASALAILTCCLNIMHELIT